MCQRSPPSITDQQQWWRWSVTVHFLQQLYSIQTFNAACQNSKRVCFGYLNINRTWQASWYFSLCSQWWLTACWCRHVFPPRWAGWKVIISGAGSTDICICTETALYVFKRLKFTLCQTCNCINSLMGRLMKTFRVVSIHKCHGNSCKEKSDFLFFFRWEIT